MVADALRYTQEARSPRSICEIYMGSSPILNTNGSIVQLDRTYLCERYNVSSNLTGSDFYFFDYLIIENVFMFI